MDLQHYLPEILALALVVIIIADVTIGILDRLSAKALDKLVGKDKKNGK